MSALVVVEVLYWEYAMVRRQIAASVPGSTVVTVRQTEFCLEIESVRQALPSALLWVLEIRGLVDLSRTTSAHFRSNYQWAVAKDA